MIKIREKSQTKTSLNNQSFLNYYDYSEKGIDLAVVECGYEKCESGHKWEGTKGFHVIHFILSGKGVFRIDGKEFSLSGGQGFYAPPDREVCYIADNDDPWEYRWIGLTGTNAVIALNSTVLPLQSVFTVRDVSVYANRLSNAYFYAMSDEPGNEYRMLSEIYSLLADLQHELTSVKNGNVSSAEYVKRCISLIREFYNTDLTISEMCEKVFVSRSYLFRMFKLYYDMSPSEYLTRFRLEKAREIIQNEGQNIRNVGEMVGFVSPSYFAKRFREAYGMTPKKYMQFMQQKRETK
ncbi:MAG: hypothetical protein CW338_08810 [Clostridiales bacterium]|nr:hypothetical protein [Clostridiales bacterium]